MAHGQTLKAQCSLFDKVPFALTLAVPAFCPQSTFVLFMWFLQWTTATISVNICAVHVILTMNYRYYFCEHLCCSCDSYNELPLLFLWRFVLFVWFLEWTTATVSVNICAVHVILTMNYRYYFCEHLCCSCDSYNELPLLFLWTFVLFVWFLQWTTATISVNICTLFV